MRLVDAELFDFISFDATGDTAYEQGFEDGVQFIVEKIDCLASERVWWFRD